MQKLTAFTVDSGYVSGLQRSYRHAIIHSAAKENLGASYFRGRRFRVLPEPKSKCSPRLRAFYILLPLQKKCTQMLYFVNHNQSFAFTPYTHHFTLGIASSAIKWPLHQSQSSLGPHHSQQVNCLWES